MLFLITERWVFTSRWEVLFTRDHKIAKSRCKYRQVYPTIFVCVFTWKTSTHTGRIFMNFDIRDFSKIRLENKIVINIWEKWGARYVMRGTLREHLRTFMIKYHLIHLLSHTNKCTNYIIYYLKSVLITDIKTLSHFHSSYVFLHITCHPQGVNLQNARCNDKNKKIKIKNDKISLDYF
jgi:hypothetical protein